MTYTPKSITYHLNSGSATDNIRYQVIDNIPVYYYSYVGESWLSSINFNYSNFSYDLMNKSLNFSGTFYTTSRTDSLPEPYRVWVVDNNTDTSYACTTQSSGQASVRGSTSFWNTFTCSNVVITFTDFKIYVGSNFYSDSEIGISKINIQRSELSDINNTNKDINNSIKDTNDTIKDDNVDNATSSGSSFFGNFSSDSHGLSGIITAPLRLINSLTTATCKPLEFNLPFVGNHVVLPCMRSIYEKHFGIFFSLWQLITTGLISYNVCINLYSKVRNLQNPNNDRIEVLNL